MAPQNWSTLQFPNVCGLHIDMAKTPMPDHRRLGFATCDLSDALSAIVKEYDLSASEMFSILAQEMLSRSNSCIRTERQAAEEAAQKAASK